MSAVAWSKDTSGAATYDKLSPNIPLYNYGQLSVLSDLHGIHTWIQMINCKPSHPSGEALIEPELAPPVHGDEVTKPLMGKFVSYNVCDAVSIASSRSLLVEQNRGRSGTGLE